MAGGISFEKYKIEKTSIKNPNLSNTVYKKKFYYNPDAILQTYKTRPVYETFVKQLTAQQLNYINSYKKAQEEYKKEQQEKQEKQEKEWAKAQHKAELLADTNNAKQLNSVGDALYTLLFGTRYKNENAATKWLYKQDWLNIPVIGKVRDVAASLSNVWEVGKDYIWDPISEGEWGIAGLNALQNLGESLDVAANPVKGAAIALFSKDGKWRGLEKIVDGSAWTDASQNLSDAGLNWRGLIGWRQDDVGRENFNIDTGEGLASGVADIVLEVVLDPSTYASWAVSSLFKEGAKAAATGVLKEVASETGEKLVKEVGSELAEKAVKETASSAFNTVVKETSENAAAGWVKRTIKTVFQKQLSGATVNVDEVVSTLTKSYRSFGGLGKGAGAATDKLSREALKPLAEEILRQTTKQSTKLLDSVAFRIVNVLDKIDDTWTAYQFLPVWGPFKGIAKLRKIANSRGLRVLEPFLDSKEGLSMMDYGTVMAKVGEVNDSLVKVAKENNMKSFNNAEIQKAFYQVAEKDIKKLQNIVGGFKMKNANFEGYESSLREYLKQTHGFADTMDTRAMLIELAGAYKKAAKSSDMFTGLHKNITDIITTYDVVKASKSYYEKVNNGIINKEIIENLSKMLSPALPPPKSGMVPKYLDLDRILKITNEITSNFDALYKQTSDNILNIIKNANPELFESAKYSESYEEFLQKLQHSIRSYLAQDEYSAIAEEHLKQFLPEDVNLKSLVPGAVLNEKGYTVKALKTRLLNPLMESLNIGSIPELIDFIKADGTAYDNLIKASEIDHQTRTVYNLGQDDAVVFFKGLQAKRLIKFYKEVSEVADELVKIQFDGLAKNKTKASLGYVDGYIASRADKINNLYTNLLDSFAKINREFDAYTKEMLGRNPKLSDNIKNIISLGSDLIKADSSALEVQVTDLIKALDTHYKLIGKADDFKVNAENIVSELNTLLDTFEETDLDFIISMTESENIPFTATLRNAIEDLDDIINVKNKDIDARAFHSVIDSLDNSFKANRAAVDKAIAEGHTPFSKAAQTSSTMQDIKFNVTDAAPASEVKHLESLIKRHSKLEFLTATKHTTTEELKAELEIVKDYLQNAIDSGWIKQRTAIFNKQPAIKSMPYNQTHSQAVFNKLETLISNARALIEIKPVEFSMIGDTVWYALKQEQTANSLVYIEDTEIFSFVEKVFRGDADIPQILKDYSDEDYVSELLEKASTEEAKASIRAVAGACELIQKGVASVKTYADLVDSIKNTPLLEQDVRAALLSTLNSTPVARQKIEDVAFDQDDLMNTIFKGIENYVNAIRKTEKYSLDYFRNKVASEEFFEKLLNLDTESWERMAHHSDADTVVTAEYIKRELPELKVKQNDIIIDIETSALDMFRGEVLEVTLNINGTLMTFKRHLDSKYDEFGNLHGVSGSIEPSNSLLDVYANGELDRAVVKNNFYKYYNKDYNGLQLAKNVAYFDDEGSLLQAVSDYIRTHGDVFIDEYHPNVFEKYHPEASRIIGHNIDDFDTKFLMQRAEQKGVLDFKDVFDRFEQVDTYKLIQKKHNFLQLNNYEKTIITEQLQSYINFRTIRNADGFRHAGEEFINAIPRELAQGLETIVRTMPEKTAVESQNKATLKYLRQHLISVRKEYIKEVNLAAGEYLFTSDQLFSEEFRMAFTKILKSDERYKNWSDAELAEHVKYLNPSKALYSGYATFNQIGFKKVFDAKAVRSWFNYPGSADAPTSVAEQLGKQMFNTVKHLDRGLARIQNPQAIVPFKESIDKFLEAVDARDLLRPTVVNQNLLRNSALQYLIKNTDAISEKYVLAKFVYTVLQNQKTATNQMLLDSLDKNIVEGIQEVIENEKLFTHRTIRDTDLTFAQLQKNIVEDETWSSVATYEALVTDFKNQIDQFELCDKLDTSGLFSPEKQVFAQAALKTFKLLDEYAHLLKTANTKQLYDAQAKVHYITEQLSEQTLRNVLQYDTPEQLIQTLAYANGVMTFAIKEADDIYDKLITNAEVLKEAGIIIVTENNSRVWLALDTTKFKYACEVKHIDGRDVRQIYFKDTLIEKPALKELSVDAAVNACKKEFTKSIAEGEEAVLGVLNETELIKLGENLKSAREGLIRNTQGNMAGVHAEYMNKEALRHIYNQAPAEIKEAMGNLNVRFDNDAWFSEATFNISNLGSTAARRQIQSAVPSHLMNTYKLTTELALKNHETRFKYIDFMLNNNMRLNVGAWADESRNEEIIRYLKEHPELTVAVLYKTDRVKKGFNIKRIAINTVEDLRNARRLNATIMSNQMYSRTAAVVYDSAYDKGALKVFANIARAYKIGQLFNPGTIMRNIFDSTLKMFITTKEFVETLETGHEARTAYKQYKNALYGMLSTSDLNIDTINALSRAYGVEPQQILNDIGVTVGKYRGDTLKDFINASVLLDKYNTCLDEIIKTNSNAVLRPDNVEFYFKYISKDLDIDTFYEVHKFITQGASAGMPRALQMAFSKGGPLVSGAQDTIMHLLNKTTTPNGYFEQVIRLTQHMQQMKSGLNFAESNLRIAKTHFDYADKLDITKSIEFIFPYYNFKIKNFEYWADILENQPWVAKVFSEYYEQVWDFDSYDTYGEHMELANNTSLQYQILSGNIPLFDTGATLKINPSFMDVANLVSDPLGSAESSLFAPLNVGFKHAMLKAYEQGLTNKFINNTFGLDDYAVEHARPLKNQLLNTLPFVGPFIQRNQQGDSYTKRIKKQEGPVWLQNLAETVPSIIGATSRWSKESVEKMMSPEEWAKRQKYWDVQRNEWLKNIISRQYLYNSKNKNYRNKNYRNKTYFKKRYAKKAYFRKAYAKRFYPKKIYPKKTYYKKPYIKKSYSKPNYNHQKYYYNQDYKSNTRSNQYYNNSNPTYAGFVKYYNQPYNRGFERSYINQLKAPKPKRVYVDNIYWKYYTKSGKKRWDILSAKATQKNLQMKIKLMYDYYR